MARKIKSTSCNFGVDCGELIAAEANTRTRNCSDSVHPLFRPLAWPECDAAPVPGGEDGTVFQKKRVRGTFCPSFVPELEQPVARPAPAEFAA